MPPVQDPFRCTRYSLRRVGAGNIESTVVDPNGVDMLVVRVRPLRGERYVHPAGRHAAPVVSIIRRGRHPLNQHWELRDLRRHETLGSARRRVRLGDGIGTAPCELIDAAGRPVAVLMSRLVRDRDGKTLGASGIDLVPAASGDRCAFAWTRATVSADLLDVDCAPVAHVADPRLLLCGLVIAVQKLPRGGDDRPNPSPRCSMGDLTD